MVILFHCEYPEGVWIESTLAHQVFTSQVWRVRVTIMSWLREHLSSTVNTSTLSSPLENLKGSCGRMKSQSLGRAHSIHLCYIYIYIYTLHLHAIYKYMYQCRYMMLYAGIRFIKPFIQMFDLVLSTYYGVVSQVMARGIIKHLKRMYAPKHWMLDKLRWEFFGNWTCRWTWHSWEFV